MCTARKIRRPRRGISIIYVLICFVALCGLTSLGVDYARVTSDQFMLQAAADAAARYGATGVFAGNGASNAVAAAAKNRIEGSAVALQAADVTVGVWNTATSTFTPGSTGANAVKVTAQLSAARGTAVPLLFASILGFHTCDVHATSIAYATQTVTTTTNVAGVDDPFLAGMPAGTTANYYSQFGDRRETTRRRKSAG